MWHSKVFPTASDCAGVYTGLPASYKQASVSVCIMPTVWSEGAVTEPRSCAVTVAELARRKYYIIFIIIFLAAQVVSRHEGVAALKRHGMFKRAASNVVVTDFSLPAEHHTRPASIRVLFAWCVKSRVQKKGRERGRRWRRLLLMASSNG